MKYIYKESVVPCLRIVIVYWAWIIYWYLWTSVNWFHSAYRSESVGLLHITLSYKLPRLYRLWLWYCKSNLAWSYNPRYYSWTLRTIITLIGVIVGDGHRFLLWPVLILKSILIDIRTVVYHFWLLISYNNFGFVNKLINFILKPFSFILKIDSGWNW